MDKQRRQGKGRELGEGMEREMVGQRGNEQGEKHGEKGYIGWRNGKADDGIG